MSAGRLSVAREGILRHPPWDALPVALAFAQYVHATGDEDYLDRIAWPVIQAVAEWVESRVVKSRRGWDCIA